MRTKFILLLILLPHGYAFAEFPIEWAVVKKGAFVIPSRDLPWTDPEGRATGKRIGYMRVGTVVRVNQCEHVNGPDDESTGDYCNVESEVGVEGKTLKTRLFALERGKVFAIARNEIVLYDRHTTSIAREKFSRNAGVIVELLGDWQNASQNEAINVIATYNLGRPGALTELAIRKSDLVEHTYVVEVPQNGTERPRKFRREKSESGEWVLNGKEVTLWSIKPAIRTNAAQLARKVLEQLGWDESINNDAEELLSKVFDVTASTLDRIRCVIKIETEVSTGFELLGNGLKLRGKIPVYNEGKFFDFDVDVVETNNKAEYWILTAKTVVCSTGAELADSEPQAIDKVTILVFKQGPFEGTPARLTVDGAERSGLSVPDAVDAYNIPRLFVIGKFSDYVKARKFISRQISNSDLIDDMTRQERIILQHIMIAKLGKFEREYLPDDIE